MEKNKCKKKNAKLTVYDFLPYFKNRNYYFAVRNSLEKIEAGEDMQSTIEYYAAKEGVNADKVKQFITYAYADKARTEAQNKKIDSYKEKDEYKFYLLQWRPATRTDTDERAQWHTQRAKNSENARAALMRKMDNDCIIFRIIECKDAGTASKKLLSILKNEGGDANER